MALQQFKINLHQQYTDNEIQFNIQASSWDAAHDFAEVLANQMPEAEAYIEKQGYTGTVYWSSCVEEVE